MKLERPLNEKELKILNKRLLQLNKNFKGQVRILFIWTLLAIIVGSLAYFKMNTRGLINLLIAVVLIFIGIGVWNFVIEYLRKQKLIKSIDYLKSKNLVTAIEVKSAVYYELTEEEDEGVYYLFQLPDNKILSFGGQDFYPNKNFPSDNFEIVEGRGLYNEILLLETFNYGKKISPAKVISGAEKWNLLNNSNYPDPEKITIIEGKLENELSLRIIL